MLVWPLRRFTPFGCVLLIVGLLLMTLGLLWGFVYRSPWLGPLAEGVAGIGLALAAVGLWRVYRLTES